MKVSVQREDFDAGAEMRALSRTNPKVGGVAAFVGLVRDVNDGAAGKDGYAAGKDGYAVGTMTLEHYPGMTEKAITAIVEEAATRWRVLDATVIHRVGELRPTDQIVLVVVASGHRGDAFAACEFIMDFLKTRAPFWKKEATPQGARWVEARDSDERAAGRWDDRAAERRDDVRRKAG